MLTFLSIHLVFVFFLWLSIMPEYSTQAVTLPPTEHLCTKIANGHFDRIHIKSITVHSVMHSTRNLLIFEGDKKHYVELSQISKTSMPMSLNDFQWNAQELRDGVSAMVHEKRLNVSQVTAIYLIYYGDALLDWVGRPRGEKVDPLAIRMRGTYLVALLYTNSTLFSMDIYKEVDLFKDHQNVYPNFALLQYQPRKAKTIGFVIHKDIYGLTDGLVMYDMKYEDLMGTVDIHRKVKVTQKERDDAIYYYIEKGKQAKTVDLVPRSVRRHNPKGEPSAQLVGSSVPRGFILNGNLYLMDTQAGCVYVIGGNIASIELEKVYKEQPNKTITFPVDGIPFESYFKCTGVSIVQPYPHKADRCEPKRNVAPILKPLVAGNAENTDIFVTVLLPVLLLLLALIGLCFTGWYCCGQSPTDEVLSQGVDLKAVQAELKKRRKQASSRRGASSSVDNEFSTSKAMSSKTPNSNVSFGLTQAKSTG